MTTRVSGVLLQVLFRVMAYTDVTPVHGQTHQHRVHEDVPIAVCSTLLSSFLDVLCMQAVVANGFIFLSGALGSPNTTIEEQTSEVS